MNDDKSKEPIALNLAKSCDFHAASLDGGVMSTFMELVAAELRWQNARIAELEAENASLREQLDELLDALTLREQRDELLDELILREQRQPLKEEQIERLREQSFSTGNPFCPCDSKTMLKAVRAAERAHKIGGSNAD